MYHGCVEEVLFYPSPSYQSYHFHFQVSEFNIKHIFVYSHLFISLLTVVLFLFMTLIRVIYLYLQTVHGCKQHLDTHPLQYWIHNNCIWSFFHMVVIFVCWSFSQSFYFLLKNVFKFICLLFILYGNGLFYFVWVFVVYCFVFWWGGGGLCVLIGGLWLFCFCLGHFVLCVKIFFRRLLVTF